MKICFVSEYFNQSYGGQYTSVKSVMDICEINNINYLIIHKKSKNFLNKDYLNNVIKKSDIIHIFGGWTLFYVKISLLALKFKKKVIVHPMGFYEPWSLSQKRIKKRVAWNLYQKKILLKADLIHCASLNEQNSLKKLNSNFKTTVLPFGIDHSVLKKKISKNIKKKCLFFSRLHKKKGLDKLLKAWIDLKNPNWSLDIIGFGDAKYYKKIYDLDKNKKVKFLQPITNKKRKFKIFDQYDLLVLPTSNENFGIVILEALSRGLPVLTTNETPWSIIQEKKAGWIINNSYIELKLALNQIFSSPDREIVKRKRNTIKIAKKFTKENLSKLYYEVYKKILIT